MAKFTGQYDLVTEVCANCKMLFAMPEDLYHKRRDDHRTFYCPDGHAQHYTGKTREQELEGKLENEKQRHQRTRERADATAKQYRKIRDRVKNGACPCCNRWFENLAAHMRTKHPDFGNHELLRSLRHAYGLTQSALAEEIWTKPTYISNFENDKPVPAEAYSRITGWLGEQIA